MCLTPKAQPTPQAPATAPDFDGVTSKRDDEAKRQKAATGYQDTILAGGKVLGAAKTGKTLLGQ